LPNRATFTKEALDIAQEFVIDYLTDLMGVGIPWRIQTYAQRPDGF
jgi:hypothetical protein